MTYFDKLNSDLLVEINKYLPISDQLNLFLTIHDDYYTKTFIENIYNCPTCFNNHTIVCNMCNKDCCIECTLKVIIMKTTEDVYESIINLNHKFLCKTCFSNHVPIDCFHDVGDDGEICYICNRCGAMIVCVPCASPMKYCIGCDKYICNLCHGDPYCKNDSKCIDIYHKLKV